MATDSDRFGSLLGAREGAIFAQSSEAILIVGEDGDCVDANPAALALLDVDRAEICGLSLWDVVAPRSPDPGGHWDGEATIRTGNGALVPVEIRTAAMPGSPGPYSVVFLRDLTELRNATLALEASDARFRTAFSNAPIGMALVHPDGQFLEANRALCTMLGYDERELLTTTFQQITHPEDLEDTLVQFQRALAGEFSTYEVEKRYFRKDGRIVWVRIRTSLLRDGQGRSNYFISQIEDVTEPKEAAAELAATHQHTRDVLERITDNFFALDDQWRFTYINEATERNFGYPRELLLGQNMWERFPQGMATPLYAALHQALADGVSRTLEFHYSPTQRWYESRIYPSVNGVSVFFRDVTDRKQQQEELQSALEAAQAGMRAKARFLGMMSHELRTPLQTILGYADLLLAGSDGQLTSIQAGDVDAIRGGATRMIALIDQLLELARSEASGEGRGREATVGAKELANVIEQVYEDMAPHAAAKHLALRIDLPGRLPSIQGDTVRLRQILLNLVGNAVKFTEDGVVEISAEVTDAGLALTVRDTGIGIPAEALPQIFAEFYQLDSAMTRRYEGAGLGLAIAKRLVEQIGGTLTVESRPGDGSSFTLHLRTSSPAAEQAPEE